MAEKCAKRGCEKEAVNRLRFVDLMHTDVDTEHTLALCAEHTQEIQKFPGHDVAGVRKWLES